MTTILEPTITDRGGKHDEMTHLRGLEEGKALCGAPKDTSRPAVKTQGVDCNVCMSLWDNMTLEQCREVHDRWP